MRILHFVGGLPRSGSTLLCNIFNQNPQIHASSTSALSTMIHGMSNAYAHSQEIMGQLGNDRDGTMQRLHERTRRYCEAWYENLERPVVLDKDRRWNYHSGVLQCLWPDAKLITISRDLRSIIASVEKRHQQTALLEPSPDLLGKTMMERYKFMFSPKGTIGSALFGMEDLIRRNPANWVRVRYEDLCTQPQASMDHLYHKMGLESFEHDFSNVVNVAEDRDELMLLKYPHEGCGPVHPPNLDEWKAWVHAEAEAKIYEAFPLYQATFNYVPRCPAAIRAAAEYAHLYQQPPPGA